MSHRLKPTHTAMGLVWYVLYPIHWFWVARLTLHLSLIICIYSTRNLLFFVQLITNTYFCYKHMLFNTAVHNFIHSNLKKKKSSRIFVKQASFFQSRMIPQPTGQSNPTNLASSSQRIYNFMGRFMKTLLKMFFFPLC